MGVLVKGMEMPARCDECPIAYYIQGDYEIINARCRVMLKKIKIIYNDEGFIVSQKRPNWCPLVEVEE